jgi:bifunctional NMN adenylyltransferase/nudix hydrolase
MNTPKQPGIGVIVGRFQVPKLTEGHIDLFNDVFERHEKVLVFLGTSPIKASRYNPLPFKARKKMVTNAFKGVPGDPIMKILEIKDVNHHVLWSKTLDEKIRKAYPEGPVTLYGSRDGFIPYYKGVFPTVSLEARRVISGSDIRKMIEALFNDESGDAFDSEEVRQAWIACCFDRFPTSYTTVDAAIINKAKNQLLLARKENDPDGKWRFIGGFVDINLDASKEVAVQREAAEETGLRGLGEPIYCGSAKIDDWRYRNEQDGIMTSLYAIYDFVGEPKAADDIAELKWFDIERLDEEIFVPEHRVLYTLIKAHLLRAQNNKGE